MTIVHAQALRVALLLAAAFMLVAVASSVPGWSGAAAQDAQQQQQQIPGSALGNKPTSDFWREIRRGSQGNVSIPDKRAGVMIQSEGDNWRAFRNGPLSTYGVWGLAGVVGLLALFFLIRGRIRIEAGPAGTRVTRFGGAERFGHWLTAVSFIILGLSGLNVLYGRYFLKDALGPAVFAQMTFYGKLVHNYVAFAFMLGLVLVFVMWIKDNFPSRTDFGWIIRAGGMLSKHSHPPAKRFNAGQKLIFWVVILGGLSLSLSGIALLFPFEFPMFAKTFEVINPAYGVLADFANTAGFARLAGFDLPASLPTTLTPMEEMQLSQAWHGAVALVMIVVIIAHIYIGSIGMEGAFDAMGSGEVDSNWAREHHSLWFEKVRAKHHVAEQQPAE